MKRVFVSLAALMLALLLCSAAAYAEGNPLISRDCPACSQGGRANEGNDKRYSTFWTSKAPDYLAYDLSGVPQEQRSQVIAVWYNPSTFDDIGRYVFRDGIPTDYCLEANAAPGGEYPDTGWVVLEQVSGNVLASRQHILDLSGYNWLRLQVSASTDGTVKLNLDVHDASHGVWDSWLFLGDSITAGGMVNHTPRSYAQYIEAMDNHYFPIQENGGIGGLRSIDGRENIDRWLSTSPAHFVVIAYGTNDAWGNSNAAVSFYKNTKYMIDAILAAGKVPVLPKIPGSTNPDVANNLPLCNYRIEQLYQEYAGKLIPGPDFEALFRERPKLLSTDGVHPTAGGYAEMRKLWAQTMYEAVYQTDSEDIMEEKLTISVNGEKLTAKFEDNSSAQALKELLRTGPITLEMRDYGEFEKVGPLGTDLPRNDTEITTQPGDVILYLGNQLTIYYDTNTWSFTRVAKIDSASADELRQILGEGSVQATFALS